MESNLSSLREELAGGPLEPLVGILSAIEVGQRTDATLGQWLKEASSEIVKLWDDRAELRDELHALANRVESLTRAVTTEPAEVAAKIVNDANRATLREVGGDDK